MKKILFAILAIVPSLVVAHAQQASDFGVREQCFATLKKNMSETTVFSTPLQTLNTTTYSSLESKFSKNYKNLSSFGIDIDRGDFEMRLYSFGKQTGYIHPPKVPLPVSTKSDLWDEPAKEFIVAEEYITDPTTNQKHFLDCAFFQITAPDLMKVTRDQYQSDGPSISITKTAGDGSYKAWYSENVSYDHESKPFVNWKRVFIYPQATRNTYFDKYDVQDAYPAHSASSFTALGFSNSDTSPSLKTQVQDGNGNTTIKLLKEEGSSGKLVEVPYPQELQPIILEGANQQFPLMTYYQAIESTFPAFAKRLSFRGTLKYETFKKLLVTASSSQESATLLATLMNPSALMVYSQNKEKAAQYGVTVSDPKYDTLFLQVQDANKAFSGMQKINPEPHSSLGDYSPAVAVGTVVTLSLLGGLWLFLKRKLLVTLVGNSN